MFSSNLMIVEQVSKQILLIMLNTSLKGLLIILCVYILLSCTKRINAQTLHLIWFLSISGFFILPIFSLLLPPIKLGSFQFPENSGTFYQAFASVVSINLRSASNFQAVNSQPKQNVYEIYSILLMLRWTFCLLVWLAGTLIAYSRSYIGNSKARKIVQNSERIQRKGIASLLNKLSVRNDVKRPIQLYTTTQIVSPFTIGVFKPVIVLPANIVKWPIADIEPVLLHEIIHIKRKDYLTQKVSMLICSVFWFIPIVWTALKKLYTEQENACDDEVVRYGIRPRHYVNQMLKIAYSIAGFNTSSGLFMINDRIKLFERRITNILEKRGVIMKKRNTVFVYISFLLVLAVLAGCVTAGKIISQEDVFTTMSGTWVNTDIEGTSWTPQKIVVYPDGTLDLYVWVSLSIPSYNYKIELLDQWVDSQGTIWYTAWGVFPNNGIKSYMYGKIHNSGNTLEYMYHNSSEPIEKWEPDSNRYNYCMYCRE